MNEQPRRPLGPQPWETVRTKLDQSIPFANMRGTPYYRDAVAAMIEANRTIYREKDKDVPIMMEATQKPKEAVGYAWEVETKNCVWSVNEGLNPKRTQWSIDNSVANGDIEASKKPTVGQVANIALATEAVEAAGGRVTIGNCTE